MAGTPPAPLGEIMSEEGLAVTNRAQVTAALRPE
jgi:hypothetical protein